MDTTQITPEIAEALAKAIPVSFCVVGIIELHMNLVGLYNNMVIELIHPGTLTAEEKEEHKAYIRKFVNKQYELLDKLLEIDEQLYAAVGYSTKDGALYAFHRAIFDKELEKLGVKL